MVNKHGNVSYNGTYLPNGNTLINTTNPTCVDFLADNCTVTSIQCNKFLNIHGINSGVTIGDLDITGNRLTVEALFNRTQAYTGTQLYAGDIISKHSGPTDVNYLLRPYGAEIRTTNGYFRTPDVCSDPYFLNNTFHVAMFYDGVNLFFYKDGTLFSQVSATGNLITNNFLTRIGSKANGIPAQEDFLGYVGEEKIWNIARTRDEIFSYMTHELQNPNTKTGLLAYYTFNSLVNRQGNTSWNGTIIGNATINQTNSNYCKDGLFPSQCNASRPSQADNTKNLTEEPFYSYLNVFPVPTTDILHLKIKSVDFIKSEVFILDMLQHVVIKQIITLNYGDNIIDLNVSKLRSGIYFLKVFDNRSQIMKKIIKF